MKKVMNIFKDMLTEKGKYSQGRVYLLWSVFAYYITLGILTYAGIRKSDIEMENFKMIVEALEYAMTLFGGYVFGGKFIDAYKAISGKKEKDDSGSKEILMD
jgi:hypothetical protein